MTRRQFLFSASGAGFPLAYDGRFIEPNWFEVTRKPVRLTRPLQNGPFRLLHLSDLHASAAVPISTIDRAITLGLAEKPDLICLTGDYITSREEHPHAEYVAALRRLSNAAPTFAVLGNHDGGRWSGNSRGYKDHRVVERILEDSGIALLHNRSVRLTLHGDPLLLTGVGDLWAHEIEAPRAFNGVTESDNVILLSHNPDSKDRLGAFPWQLMLSGHTHGGQVVFPLLGPVFAPVKDKRYVAGLKPWGSRQIHVTRGVGSIDGVRFLCRPEVSMLLLS